MSAKVLTRAAAKEAKIALIENGRGTQAVHDVVVAMRAARRSGTANTKTKADVDYPERNRGGKKELGVRVPVTNRPSFGAAVASFSGRSRVIIPRKRRNQCAASPFKRH